MIAYLWTYSLYYSYLLSNSIVEAHNYLAYLETNEGNSEELMDFIQIQYYNLKRIEFGVNSINSEELNSIRTLAHENHPYSAYAKSLFYILTDELIVSDMPSFDKAETRSSQETSSNSDLKFYPNPFTNELNIDLDIIGVQIEVYDVLGHSIISKYCDSNHSKINTENWEQGIYYISIYHENEIVHTGKLFIKI
jgi:hypothetical protein